MFATYPLLQPDLPQIFNQNINIISSTSAIPSYLWTFGILACTLASVAMMIKVGLKYPLADSGAKVAEINDDAKHAIYGILAVLILWLLFNTINPNLIRGEISFAPIKNSATQQTPQATKTDPTTSDKALQKMVADEYAKRALLCGGDGKNCSTNTTGVRINNGPCTQIGQSSCTSIGGIAQEVVGLFSKLSPGEQITITGGTEWWLHGGGVQDISKNTSKHKPSERSVGGGGVDLRLSDKLNKYITSQGNNFGAKINPSGYGCSEQYVLYGFTFCNETLSGNSTGHWHVQ